MYQKHPSVKFLIENFSKARVIKAAPADPVKALLGLEREITNQDVIDSMIRKYAK